MAHIITKGEGDSYSYAALAELRQRADKGDASAAIILDRLPDTEKRLAADLVKAYGGEYPEECATCGQAHQTWGEYFAKAEKAQKPAKRKLSKADKHAIKHPAPNPDDFLNRQLAQWLNSDNPQDRETARNILRERRVL